jgi:hypothetical protein
MIIETIFSTLNEFGAPNFAPMGLVWGEDSVIVRPFRNTQTCRNLLLNGCGVANISDDVLAYAQCALYDQELPHFPAGKIQGAVYEGACEWRELEVVSRGGSEERAELRCRVLHSGKRKDFLGFCRAANAVVEAIILATRLPFYDRKIVDEKMVCYGEIVGKTGGANEKQALLLVEEFIRKAGTK